jgi:hypothetical protein
MASIMEQMKDTSYVNPELAEVRKTTDLIITVPLLKHCAAAQKWRTSAVT